MEKLIDQVLVAHTIESIVHKSTECSPGQSGDLMLDRLVPQRRWPVEMHLADLDPEVFLDKIDAKIFLGQGFPAPRVLTIKPGKRKFRNATCLVGSGRLV